MRKAQGPFHHEGDLHGPVGVAWHVDVGIDHDHDLGPHVGGHGGQQGGARLAGEVLVHRQDDAEGDANRGPATFSSVGELPRRRSSPGCSDLKYH
jgi:hypothetical protein